MMKMMTSREDSPTITVMIGMSSAGSLPMSEKQVKVKVEYLMFILLSTQSWLFFFFFKYYVNLTQSSNLEL